MTFYESYQKRKLGAFSSAQVTEFRVWAQKAEKTVELILTSKNSPTPERLKMQAEDRGYFYLRLPKNLNGCRYQFSMDGGQPLPDPCSRFQPDGVHGSSQLVDEAFSWTDHHWKGVPRSELTIYELHVGTFSFQGTFEGVIEHLPRLRELGVNAIELMPLAQFPGQRNWGYDGVFPFAVQNSYGGPLALKRLIDACHQQDIAVILDVVYNHLGPEGNVLGQFGSYFQNRYKTPWGEALNYDGAHSDEVKNYFCQNAIQWLEEFHFDGLRLDAIHSICDWSQQPFLEILEEIKTEIEKKSNRPLHLIAESDLNDPKVLRSSELGGYGLDLQWNDDFHHALHVELTQETKDYYQDFNGLRDLAASYKQGTVYNGQFSVFRKCSRGRSFSSIAKERLVVYSQNHDQIGNRPRGDRLISEVGLKKQNLAAACTFLSPFTPLIFMGEETAVTQPFCYFIDHQDPALIEAVRKGRKEEFKSFFEKHHEEIPDPASEQTFQQCVLSHANQSSEAKTQFLFYQKLIQLSKWIRREKIFDCENLSTFVVEGNPRILQVCGKNSRYTLWALFSFQKEACQEILAFQEHQKHKEFKVLFHSDLSLENSNLNSSGKIMLPGFSAALVQGFHQETSL